MAMGPRHLISAGLVLLAIRGGAMSQNIGPAELQEQEQPVQVLPPQQQDAVPMSVTLLGEDAERQLDALVERHSIWTVRPRVDLHPAHVSEPRPSLTLDLGAVGRKAIHDLAFTLNGERLDPDDFKVSGTTLVLTPSLELRVGYNELVLSYVHPDPPGEADDPIRFIYPVNYQPSPTPVHYGPRGELIVNGQPRFVVGGFRSGQTDDFVDALDTAKAAGLSWVHDYANGREKDILEMGLDAAIERARTYLRRADELGLGVLMSLPRQAVREVDESVLARWISELSGEPALWFWYLYDEPLPPKVTALALSRTYRLVKRLDPHHPAVVVIHREEASAQFGPFADAIWPDKYPITATGRSMISLTPVYADILRTKELVGDTPVAPILQLHDNRSIPWLRRENPDLAKPSDADHRPTADEVRAMAHVALAAGVRGLGYYWAPENWYSMKRDAPQHWANFVDIVHELNALGDIVLADEPAEPVSIDQPVGGKTLSWSRVHDGRLYLAVVNTDVYETRRIGLPEVSGAQGPWSVHAAWAGSELLNASRVNLGPAGVLIAFVEIEP